MGRGGQHTHMGMYGAHSPCPFPAPPELKVKMNKTQHYGNHQVLPTPLQTSVLLDTVYTNGSKRPPLLPVIPDPLQMFCPPRSLSLTPREVGSPPSLSPQQMWPLL